jgi:hypothetical protein
MSKRNDEYDLIQRLFRGDPCAFDEIFRSYNAKVYAFSLKNLF